MKWLALCTPRHTPGQRQEKIHMHTHTNGKQARRRIIELFSFSSQLPLFYWSHRSFLVAQSITSSALWENSASWPLSLHAGGFSVSNGGSLYKTLCWRNRPSACTDRLCSHPNMFTTCLPTFLSGESVLQQPAWDQALLQQQPPCWCEWIIVCVQMSP